MASPKRVLTIATGVLVLVGIAFALTPFVISLTPNAKAYANLPRFQIPNLKASSHAFVQDPMSDSRDFGLEILVVKRASGHTDYWYIPTYNGLRSLPDYYWWRPGQPCDEWTTDFEKEEIHCTEVHTHFDYRWSFDGQSLSEHSWVPNLEPVKGKEKNGDFVLYHPSD